MKKLFSSIGGVFGILFILACLVSACTPKKAKRLILKRSVIGLLVIGLAWQIGTSVYDYYHPYNDCVPATLHRIFPERSLSELNKLCKLEREGSNLTNVLAAWSVISTNGLELQYSAVEDVKVENSGKIAFGIPYLWIGKFNTNWHCALVSFTETNAIFSHSQFYPGTTNYYVTEMEYYDFFERTLLLYRAKELNETIRMR